MKKMVGVRGLGYSDYTSQEIWQNLEYEYAGLFFSIKHAGKGKLFEGLEIWKETKYDGQQGVSKSDICSKSGCREEYYRKLQGTYPVLFLSFAGVKHTDFENTRYAINKLIKDLYNRYAWMLRL